MDEPSPAPVADSPAGFSCPGPLYIPGLLVIPAVHIGVLAAALGRARAVGLSWPLAGVAIGGLAAFWVAFLAAAQRVGGRGAVNLLGLAAVVLFWGGSVVGLVVAVLWWLVG